MHIHPTRSKTTLAFGSCWNPPVHSKIRQTEMNLCQYLGPLYAKSRDPSSLKIITNMKTLYLLFFMTLCLPGFGQSEKDQSITTNVLQNELGKAGSNNVMRIEVFYFPEDIETEFAVNPTDLEKAYWAKTIVADFKRSKFRLMFLQSLAESNIQNRKGRTRDLRWGCVFFDSNDTRILSLYLDQSGMGEVNGIQIESNGKILELLRQKFAFR